MKVITNRHRPFLIWLTHNIDTYQGNGYLIRSALKGVTYHRNSKFAMELNKYRDQYLDEYLEFVEFHKTMATFKYK